MARLVIALIRHGDYEQLPDTPSAHQPFPLTAAGEAQARQAATLLRETAERHRWCLVTPLHSSQMLRAWQTADILARELADLFDEHPTIDCFDELAERGLGAAANLTLAQIEQVLAADPRYEVPPPGWKADSYYRLPLQGAESLLQAGARVAGHLQRVQAALARTLTQDSLFLCVGHGAAFRHAAAHLGVLRFDDIPRLSMYHARPVLLEVDGAGRWQHLEGAWKVRATGETGLD